MTILPPPPPPPRIRSIQTHCSHCGRELEPATENNGYDPYTGEPRTSQWLQCPRFPRSWRNLWVGGLCHDSPSADPESWMERQWL